MNRAANRPTAPREGLATAANDAVLLVTAAIWGFAFVAQRVGMEHVGPFTYNAVRFALGALSLVPLIVVRRRRRVAAAPTADPGSRRTFARYGLGIGIVLFAGASLQQAGIVTTTAGKAGFITGLYVVLVPLFGLLAGQKAGTGRWIAVALAVAGLYLLSIREHLAIEPGDLLVLIGAFFWAGHVQLVGRWAPRVDPIELAAAQFAVCSAGSSVVAIVMETAAPGALRAALVPILYGGLLSVGVAYTLQVVAQKRAHPTHAAILLSLEGAFAAVGGALVLGEHLTARELVGCALLLAGMLLSQLAPRRPSRL
jgi:drug/metabolite transporter (DMT)-like permease